MKLPIAQKFFLLWNALRGPNLAKEVILCPPRKWRFDFVQPESKVIIEIEGGIWVNGAHTRGNHFNSDCEKYNTATILGYHVFRLTTDLIDTPRIRPIIDFSRLIIEQRMIVENVPLGFVQTEGGNIRAEI